ncbi:MAG: helix-turn-helix domain-containing protein [Acidimicrobiales bacterium]
MSVVSLDALPADPLAALRELTRGEAELEAVRRAKVVAARDAGASWEQVGEALGVSRQSAWEYYSSAARSQLAANVEANADLSEADAMDLAVEEVRAVRRRRRKS